MLLNTIYEHFIDKQNWKGILNIVSGVKYHFDVWLPICYVCYINFSAFFKLIFTLNYTFIGHFNLFQTFLVCLLDKKIIICLKWNLSAHIKRLYQIDKAYKLLWNNIFLNFKKNTKIYSF